MEIVQGTQEDPCQTVTSDDIDCNKLSVQPDFSIPKISYESVRSDGAILAGDYQFAIQYSNALGEAYTSYYSVTNPLPIYDFFRVGPDFNYEVARSIVLNITDIDTSRVFDYFNIAVIKTVNDISSVDLVGTFEIQGSSQSITYTGQSKAGITLTIDDIFEKFPVYDTAGDVTSLQDILVWGDLTSTQRISYQKIANRISLQWVSWKLPPNRGQYSDEKNAADLRGYMRDEIYAFDIVFILKNGYQTDRFPIPGRLSTPQDLELVDNDDARFEESICDEPEAKPRWQVYNTASVLGIDPEYNPDDDCYQGPFEYGEFAYWESSDLYPCNEEVWGDLAGLPIRHHKFPDSSVSPHHDNSGNIYPLGVRIDIDQVHNLIINSSLSDEEKNNIAAFKIVRSNRANSASIVAKGLLFNTGRYSKENTVHYYPNYPFNDLRADPFIENDPTGDIGSQIYVSFDEQQSVESDVTDFYSADIPADTWKNDEDIVSAVYRGSFGNSTTIKKRLRVFFDGNEVYSSGLLSVNGSNQFTLTIRFKRVAGGRINLSNRLEIIGQDPKTINSTGFIVGVDFSTIHNITLAGQAINLAPPPLPENGDITTTSAEIGYTAAPVLGEDPNLLNGFNTPESENRFTFHSPDTSFYQPFLGNILKLESVEYGSTRSHFVQVDKHSRYRFPSLESSLTALGVGVAIGFASGTYGVSTNVFSGTAAFTAFQTFNDIVFRLLPKKNMAYQFNSIGNYTSLRQVSNDTGEKIRQLDIAAYLISGIQGVGDIHLINNYQRESSVYLRTTQGLPFPHEIQGVPEDNSRFTLGEVGCVEAFYNRDISAYYASIKNNIVDQYGQIYSYEALDTGFQMDINLTEELALSTTRDIFGGDTFINKFAFKRKLPFFIDNRVNFPDESDVFYDELGNIGYPRYWFSTDIRRGDGGAFNIGSIFGVKVNNFDCENAAFFYDAGKIYLFAYGIVNFFVESQVNVDLRQPYNSQEGDYYPHVGTDVPDSWLQEANVSIAFDNTYTYNKTYSKQNKENVFTALPVDFVPDQQCSEQFPNRAIYSERQQDTVTYKKNNWRIYRPASVYDFPLNYGRLISLDGIETKQLLARFESRAQIYNSLLTVNSSIGDAYLGQQIFSDNVPPVDLSSTDSGYTGSQNKFFLRTEFGHIWADARRGDIFLLQGTGIKNIANEGLKMFLTDNLPFRMKEAFPEYDIDNNFNGVGLHGVYDNRYHRIIITKLDYMPLSESIFYNPLTGTFSIGKQQIELGDPEYFCDVSFTISYSLLSQSWTSFHSYLPNFYVEWTGKFYSGRNDLFSLWSHNTDITAYNRFYGETAPYILEYPFFYKYQDEILQAVKDYTKVDRIIDSQRFVQTNDNFFNKVIAYNDQQCSGVRNLINKPKNNMSLYLQYPKYNTDSIDVLFVKSDNFYNYNGLWDIVKDYNEPIWVADCTSSTENKVLNTDNLNYSNQAFKKYPLRAKDSRLRYILDNRTDLRLTSQFVATETQISYK